MPDEEKLIKPEEAAKILGLKQEEVELLAHSGYIPYYKIGGAYLRFKKDQLEAARDEIRSKLPELHAPAEYAEPPSLVNTDGETSAGFFEAIGDFWYFNNFYILSGILMVGIVYFIITRIL